MAPAKSDLGPCSPADMAKGHQTLSHLPGVANADKIKTSNKRSRKKDPPANRQVPQQVVSDDEQPRKRKISSNAPSLQPVSKDAPSQSGAALHTDQSAPKPDQRKKHRGLGPEDQQIVDSLMEGPPGMSSPRPVALRLFTRHRTVAWQWMSGGKMCYPVPIGCSRPLSPFSSSG